MEQLYNNRFSKRNSFIGSNRENGTVSLEPTSKTEQFNFDWTIQIGIVKLGSMNKMGQLIL